MGEPSVGFSGRRGAVVRVRKLRLKGASRHEDLGYVGKVSGFSLGPLLWAWRNQQIPILSSVGVGAGGKLYNVNADDVAGALAARLKAAKLILMTDVAGIQDGQGRLLSSLTAKRASALIGSRVISKGMIPKVRSCLGALRRGVKKAHVVDGRLRHSLLLEIFTTRGVGTEIIR